MLRRVDVVLGILAVAWATAGLLEWAQGTL